MIFPRKPPPGSRYRALPASCVLSHTPPGRGNRDLTSNNRLAESSLEASRVALAVKNLPANAGDARDVSSAPGLGRSPEGAQGNQLQYFAWRIPWTEEPGGLPFIGSQRGGCDLSDLAHICMPSLELHINGIIYYISGFFHLLNTYEIHLHYFFFWNSVSFFFFLCLIILYVLPCLPFYLAYFLKYRLCLLHIYQISIFQTLKNIARVDAD